MKIALTADWHSKTDNPICRLDNYFDTLMGKIDWIHAQIGSDGKVLAAGDIFDTGKPQSYLKMYKAMVDRMRNTKTIAGNHDISYRTMAYVDETAYGALSAITGMHIDEPFILDDYYEVHPFNFGEPIEHRKPYFGRKMLAMTHQFVWDKKVPFDAGINALDLMIEYPEYDIILSGDNHQHFIVEFEGRTLVNPGSLMRMDADQIDYQPKLVILEDGKITVQDVPIAPDVVSRKHLEIREASMLARDTMMAYLELAKSSDKETYDFLSLLLEKTSKVEDVQVKNLLMGLYSDLKDGK